MELFALKNKYAMDNPVHKIDFIKYSPDSLATVNNNNSSTCQEKMLTYVYKIHTYHYNLKFSK